MFDNNTKEELRSRLTEFAMQVTQPSPKAGKNMYVCPLCNSGGHGGHNSDGALHITGDQWFCHACGKGGDIFRLYALTHNLNEKEDFPEILEGLCGSLGMSGRPSARGQQVIETSSIKRKAESMKTNDEERRRNIEAYAKQMPGSVGEEYLHSRGFTDETITHFKFGFNPSRWDGQTGNQHETIVIPYPGADYYTERLIVPGDSNKYKNQPGEAPLFVINESTGMFFITEGQLDAISLYQAGEKNVIACHYPRRLSDWLDTHSIGEAVIVADRDAEEKRSGKDGLTPGERHAESIVKVLTEHGVKSVIVYPPEGYKDVNDILAKNTGELEHYCQVWKKTLELQKLNLPERENTVKSYLLSGDFDKDVQYFSKYKDRKTGFSNLDPYVTLYPGVCCLGGASSLGKTTFAVNLADNLLARGESVIYFSLEQRAPEIITKSLARRLYEMDPMSPLTNIDIKNGATSDALTHVKAEYAEIADKYEFVEADFHWTAKKISDYVEKYVRETHRLPVVVIDYLQIIAAPEGFRGTEREKIDENLKEIKDLSKKHELFILLISSFNRTNYITPVSYESYKESGMIEHTCDYIFGLQLSILEDSEFYTEATTNGGGKEKNLDKKRRAVHDAQKQIDKEVELVVLKNRNGKQSFKAFFRYRMDFDVYRPDNHSPHDHDHENGEQRDDKQLHDILNAPQKETTRDRQKRELEKAIEQIAKDRGAEGVTVKNIADYLDLSTGTVARRLKEFGGFSVDGQDYVAAGANAIVRIKEFNPATKSDVIPFE